MIEQQRHGHPNEPAINARRASKVFATGDGVHDMDLAVPSGSIFGFIGPSGAGKTTAVRMLTGAIEPTDGQVTVLGQAPTSFDHRTRSQIGYMPQLSVLYDNLSVADNLKFFASLYGMTRRRTEAARNEMLEFVDLGDHRDKRVTELSGGMRRRLSLAATLVHEPRMIFLDEPTAGIDPVLRRRLWDHFTEMRDEGRTLFITTQYVGEAAYCDRVGVIADGRLIADETPDGLRRAAFGGDIVHLELEQPLSTDLIRDISNLVSATACQPYSMRGLRIVVEEAALSLPELTTWLASQGVSVAQAEEHMPPFDDVFVELVEEYRAATTDTSTEGERVVA